MSRRLLICVGIAAAAPAGCGDDGGATAETEGSSSSAGSGSGEATTGTSAGESESESEGESEGEPAPLVPDPGAARYALVGEAVVLDGSGSQGAVKFQWFYDDGEGGASEVTTSPIATVVYEKKSEGRRRPILTVFDAEGKKLSASVTITVVEAPVWQPRQASSVIALPAVEGFAAVSPDSDEVMIAGSVDGSLAVLRRAPVGREPRTVAAQGGWLVVAAHSGDQIDALPVEEAMGEGFVLALPYGAAPYGVIAGPAQGQFFVTLQGRGEVAEIGLDPRKGLTLVKLMAATPDARGLAMLPDGRLAASRWRSAASGGALAIVDPSGQTPAALWTAAFDPQASSDTEIGGVPSYLGSLVVAPNGREAALPSLQANIGEGAFLKPGSTLEFDTTVRAVVSYFDVVAGTEVAEGRKQFDGRGLASAAVYSYFGDYLFVATRGARSVERIDRFTGAESSSLIDVGFAPQGLALSADGRFLAVDAYLARELVVYDLGEFAENTPPLVRLPIPSVEPLAPQLLQGKRLFNDSLDPRLSQDGYLACAHCHLDGDSDRQVWDFTDRGEGLRDTISLLGRAGAGDGGIHWSANFDEIQDFEHDIRGPFGGLGLMGEAEWQTGSVASTLGDPKAGLSADLDALAAYVGSLTEERRSPHREADGALPAAAELGQALFESPALGCKNCHSGPRLTNSGWIDPGVPLLHDVGTLGPGSGQRLGAALTGLDTPTLHGLWHSAPYLHDGSAATLKEVLTTRNVGDLHGVTSGLSAAEVEALVSYLLCLDGQID